MLFTSEVVTQSHTLECLILNVEKPLVALKEGKCMQLKSQGQLARSLMFETGGP